MARRAKSTRKNSRPKLSAAEVRRQHAAELPDREAMSLVLPTTGGLPIMSTDPVGGTGYAAPATDYSGAATQTAASSTHDATQLAPSGVNAPGGTATSSSAT